MKRKVQHVHQIETNPTHVQSAWLSSLNKVIDMFIMWMI